MRVKPSKQPLPTIQAYRGKEGIQQRSDRTTKTRPLHTCWGGKKKGLLGFFTPPPETKGLVEKMLAGRRRKNESPGAEKHSYIGGNAFPRKSLLSHEAGLRMNLELPPILPRVGLNMRCVGCIDYLSDTRPGAP